MSERLGNTIRGAGFDAWGDEVCALGRQLADAKEEIERLTVALLDVVNQACQQEHRYGNCVVSDLAISAYEDAIGLLEDIGRAKRLPGKLLLWELIWS